MRSRYSQFQTLAGVLVLCVILLLIGIPLRSPELSYSQSPRIGAWNRFLKQSVVVECWNDSDGPVAAELALRDSNGERLHTAALSLNAHGSVHYALDPHTSENSYGTFQLRIVEGESRVNCQSNFYRFINGSLEFSYSLPMSAPLNGTTFGLFNSYNPAPNSAPVANWLAVYNPGGTAFSADVVTFDQSGTPAKVFPVRALAAFGRIDIPLGHPDGQRVGMYEIRPLIQDQPYAAYLARFAELPSSKLTAYTLLPSAGSGMSSTLSVSTMNGADNWLEIANSSGNEISIAVTLKDQQGGELSTQLLKVAPKAQQHLFVNSVLGPEAIGRADLRCRSSSCVHDSVVAQSLFYGPGASGITWAYGSQALPDGASKNAVLSFSVNTFLEASNWLKMFNRTSQAENIPARLFGAEGQQLSFPQTVSLAASHDLPLHETFGPDAIGSVSIDTSLNGLNAEALRVYTGADGSIQAIAPIRSIELIDQALEYIRRNQNSAGTYSGVLSSIVREPAPDGSSDEKVVARGWICQPTNSADTTVQIMVENVSVGSGIANKTGGNADLCPGKDVRQFAIVLTLPTDLALIGKPILASVGPATDSAQLADQSTAAVLSPGLLKPIFGNLHPKGVIFRSGVEGGSYGPDLVSNPAKWISDMSGQDVTIGKALQEELLNPRSAAVASGLSQISAKPEKVALLHFNGWGMLPTFPDAAPFSPKDWLYFPGCNAVAPIQAGNQDLKFEASCVKKFRDCLKGPHSNNPAAPACFPENVAIVHRNPSGNLDWSKAEYAVVAGITQITEANPAGGNIVRTILSVQRGQFGTSAQNFPVGSYIAPISGNGPWMLNSDQQLWNYNYHQPSTRQKLAALLAAKFAPGGELQGVQGITLDVSPWIHDKEFDRDIAKGLPARKIDVDTDGVADGGYLGTVNVFGVGVRLFHQELRNALGNSKLILADGGHQWSSRDWHLLNGRENEGIGESNDAEFAKWSTGVNFLTFSNNPSALPQFKYVVHKNVPAIAGTRMAMATAVMLDAAFANVVNPITDLFSICSISQWQSGYVRNGFPVLDEMVKGVENKSHWLGEPVEPLRRIALTTASRNPAGVADLRSLLQPLANEPVVIRQQSAHTRIDQSGAPRAQFAVSLPGLSAAADQDFVLSLEVKSVGALDGFSNDLDVPRSLTVTTTANILPIKGSGVPDPREQNAMFGSPWTRAVFYFRNNTAQTVDFEIAFEGSAAVAVRNIKIFHAPDVLARRYQNGLVLANPSGRQFRFNLASMYPGRKFKRLTATPCQDQQYNDGRIEAGQVTVAPKDGLFLIDNT